jgi:hypothetical protein
MVATRTPDPVAAAAGGGECGEFDARTSVSPVAPVVRLRQCTVPVQPVSMRKYVRPGVVVSVRAMTRPWQIPIHVAY